MSGSSLSQSQFVSHVVLADKELIHRSRSAEFLSILSRNVRQIMETFPLNNIIFKYKKNRISLENDDLGWEFFVDFPFNFLLSLIFLLNFFPVALRRKFHSSKKTEIPRKIMFYQRS